MRVQFVSDLHLEVFTPRADSSFEQLLLPSAPVLALCGDIGRPGSSVLRAFLEWCAARFAHVLLVAGNHEAWASRPFGEWQHMLPLTPQTIDDRHAALRADCVAAGPHVRFLENEALELADGGETVTVLGCTLWTLIPPAAVDEVQCMADYDRVAIRGATVRVATPRDTTAWHAASRAWLTSQLQDVEGPPVLVLTHHLPVLCDALTPRAYIGASLNVAFGSDAASDVLAAPGGHRVKAWLCGHSHVAGRVPVAQATVAVNARGYQHEAVPGWARDAVVEF